MPRNAQFDNKHVTLLWNQMNAYSYCAPKAEMCMWLNLIG